MYVKAGAVTKQIVSKGLVSQAIPYGLWPARCACVMRARCAPCFSRGSLRSAMDIATRPVDNQSYGLPCGAVDKRNGQAASPSCGSLRDLTTA